MAVNKIHWERGDGRRLRRETLPGQGLAVRLHQLRIRGLTTIAVTSARMLSVCCPELR